MVVKRMPPAATPEREGRERALVQNQEVAAYTPRPAVFAEKPVVPPAKKVKEGPEFSKDFVKRGAAAVSQKPVKATVSLEGAVAAEHRKDAEDDRKFDL